MGLAAAIAVEVAGLNCFQVANLSASARLTRLHDGFGDC